MSNIKFREFPVFPMVTYDQKFDSPINAKWKIITYVPPHQKLVGSKTKESKMFLVNDEWGVIVWLKTDERLGREGAEISLYEASKGKMPLKYHEIGKARTRALRGSQGVSLIETKVDVDMVKRQRYSGAIVEREQSIQIWLRLSGPEDQGSPTTDATASASSSNRNK
tara:strand:- start:1209 stop:1709 length:501 start_codon:yes stop_codon:yes gene_type:complete